MSIDDKLQALLIEPSEQDRDETYLMPPTPDTIRKTRIAIALAETMLQYHKVGLVEPTISKGPDKSIDVHWNKSGEYSLLLNVPEKEKPNYFGEIIVKGELT